MSEKVRPYLRPAKSGDVDGFHGLLKDHAKTVTPEAEERTKRAYMRKRVKAREGAV